MSAKIFVILNPIKWLFFVVTILFLSENVLTLIRGKYFSTFLFIKLSQSVTILEIEAPSSYNGGFDFQSLKSVSNFIDRSNDRLSLDWSLYLLVRRNLNKVRVTGVYHLQSRLSLQKLFPSSKIHFIYRSINFIDANTQYKIQNRV